MRRIRALSLVAIAGATMWACTDGSSPTVGGRPLPLDLVPHFQLDPSLFSYDPIDRIRLVAIDVATSEVVGGFDETVDPSAASWSLPLIVDLGDEISLDVIVEIELLSGTSVEWSGRAGPFTVRLGSLAQGVDVYPGPLDNLDVVSVQVDAPPSQLLVGATVDASASVALALGSSATPVVFWASSDPTVAIVTQEGPTTTITGIAPGTTDIIAAAGEAYFEFSLDVVAEVPAGSKTWVGGDAGDPTGWDNPDNWSPVGVPGANDAVVIGQTGNDPSLTTSNAVASISLIGSRNIDLNGNTLTVSGDLDGDVGAFSDGRVLVVGGGTVLHGVFPDLELVADRALSSPSAVLGDLTLSDARLDMGAHTLNVDRDLLVDGPGGALVMSGGSSVVTVFGDATFNGASHEGLLTDGFLGLQGDLIATDASPTSFVSSGSHLVSFNGASAQTVTFENPGLSQQRLGNVYIANQAGVTFQTDAYATGAVEVLGWMTVPANTMTAISGTLTLFNTSTLEVDGTVTAADCVDQGATLLGSGTQPCGPPPAVDRTWQGNSTAWSDPNNWSPAGVPGSNDNVLVPSTQLQPVLSSDHSIGSLTVGTSVLMNQGGFTLTVAREVQVSGGSSVTGGLVHLDNVDATPYPVTGTFEDLRVSAPRTVLGGTMTLIGDLDVRSELTIGQNTVVVNGDLIVQSANGSLVMNQVESAVGVYGDVTFSGASSVGNLTGGVLQVLGDFTATSANSPTSFQSGGTIVYLTPQGDMQTVNFDNAGPSGQSFADVYIFHSGQGEVTVFETDALVTGLLSGGNLSLEGSGSAILEVTGTLELDVVSLDGLPLRLESSEPPADHALENLTFMNMPPDVDHLHVEIPGAGANSPLNIPSPVFTTVPSNGYYHLRAVNAVPTGQMLHVTLITPIPTPPPAAAYTAGTNVEVIWP